MADTVDALRDRPGLTSSEAARLLSAHGRNELPAEPGPTIVSRVRHQLRDPMILLLCGAFVLVVAVGDRPDAAIIAAVVVLNTVIGVVQDVRAQHAVDALSRMAAPVAQVWRDGRLRRAPGGRARARVTWSAWRLETSSRPICRWSMPSPSRSTSRR